LLSADARTVAGAKCFVCGRPVNEGEHSHPGL
jgi:hypothetical protein